MDVGTPILTVDVDPEGAPGVPPAAQAHPEDLVPTAARRGRGRAGADRLAGAGRPYGGAGRVRAAVRGRQAPPAQERGRGSDRPARNGASPQRRRSLRSRSSLSRSVPEPVVPEPAAVLQTGRRGRAGPAGVQRARRERAGQAAGTEARPRPRRRPRHGDRIRRRRRDHPRRRRGGGTVRGPARAGDPGRRPPRPGTRRASSASRSRASASTPPPRWWPARSPRRTSPSG